MAAKYGRIRFQLIAVTAFALAVVWSVVALVLLDQKRETMRLGEVRAQTLAHAFAENAFSTVRLLDVALAGLADDWSSSPKTFAERAQRIRRQIPDISFQVSATDASGMVVYSDLGMPANPVNVSDREHIRAHLGGGPGRLFISAPVRGRVSGKWSIQFSRPIPGPSGVQGVLVLSVAPVYFRRFYDGLELDNQDIVLLAKTGGEILARFPGNDEYLGGSLKGVPFLAPDASVQGIFRRNAQTDGVNRQYGYYRLPESGLVAIVGLSVDSILGSYMRRRLEVTSTGAALSVLVLVVFVLMARNLRERERNAAELLVMNAQLEEKVGERTAEIEAFMYSVSHDLRAPLRAINGFSALLQESPGLDDGGEQLDLLRRIRENATRMDLLLNDLLDLSRYSTMELHKERVDMRAKVDSVIADLRAGAGLATFEIGDLPECWGERILLRQVWYNLIANALKYSTGESAPLIRIGFADGAYFVSDNGVGFDMAYSAKLFKLFSRLHSDRVFQGTGVGLAIVKRIVERHGGQVSAAGATGNGATFSFTLPAGAIGEAS
jgi:signal transduction histidine kinase